MDRWIGVLRIPLRFSSSSSSTVPPHFKVAASLSYSLPSKSLIVPSTNAVFFTGDRVEGSGDCLIEELSDPRNLANLLVSKLGGSTNAWVVEPPSFNGHFAIYEGLVPTIDALGNPTSYDAEGFPASSAVVALLSACLEEAKNLISAGQPDWQHNVDTQSAPSIPRTVLFGFSKGGVVINQILTELAHVEFEPREDTYSFGRLLPGTACRSNWCGIPNSKEGFLSSISDIHYVDVGLNTSGAYMTHPEVVQALGLLHQSRNPFPLRVFFHGTPRQWCDDRRPWIRQEKDLLCKMLRDEASRSNGKLDVLERLYYAGMPPSLHMHFGIIKDMDVT